MNFFKKRIYLCALVYSVSLLSGWITLAYAQDSKKDTIWRRIRDAAVESALEPETWLPLAGAAALKFTNTDHKLSNWAAKNTPIFGSKANADRYSDYLVAATYAANFVTSFAASRGGNGWEPVNKLRLIEMNLVAWMSTSGSISLLKRISHRMRPDSSDYKSFPSAHTSIAAMNSMLASQNLRYMSISNNSKNMLRLGFTALTVGTAWARLESGKHYATDVLVGEAFGNFLGSFVRKLFIKDKRKQGVKLIINPFSKTCMIGVRFYF